MKIKLNKQQWQLIGKKTGWTKSAQEIRYYLETYVDDQQMLGSDGTTVLGNNISNLQKQINNRINILKGLSKEIKPNLNEAKNVILKLVDNNGKCLKIFDVTPNVQN